ncbi:MAG TPA: sigma-70 family RNA polymerase sigma factor [Spirochaetota bacterium]|nr:sigma-70 family RNA polymerase sigma factor [Spirochaetota bacterium]HPI21926.1 sigma-70 family RNA polymerase sigma factor [Spirochaetota bacterium]HPU88175.1 sigma-70 family RNA polymerase sigma factor [Spirochaetota bacterium]
MFLKNREFAEAYNDLYPVVFGAVYSKVGNPEDAQDICQELFVKLYEKLETIENRRKWLYGALRLEVMAYYRKKKPDGVDIDEVFADVGLTFVNGFRDARIVISGAIEHDENFEDERERALFDLVAVQNYSYEQAGMQLGMSKRQVRYRYGLIVERILAYLQKQGIKSLEDLL